MSRRTRIDNLVDALLAVLLGIAVAGVLFIGLSGGFRS